MNRASLCVGMAQLFSSQQIYVTMVATQLLIWTSQSWLPRVQAKRPVADPSQVFAQVLWVAISTSPGGHDLLCCAKTAGGPHGLRDAGRTIAQVGRSGRRAVTGASDMLLTTVGGIG